MIFKTTIKDETDKWRDHVLRDRTEEMSNSKQKIVTGWKCMNFTECAAFGYHVIHCDDDQCTSGSCTTEDNFLENLEESSSDDQCYDRSRYKNGWLEKNIPQAGFPIGALSSLASELKSAHCLIAPSGSILKTFLRDHPPVEMDSAKKQIISKI